jgi:pyruvate ferredoxin oxidoreductase delta subunit
MVKLPVLKPIDGAAGRTADWRTVRPKFIQDKCTRCFSCWLFCPDTAISMSEDVNDGFPVFDDDYCKGCSICAEVCPRDAIEMVPDVGD